MTGCRILILHRFFRQKRIDWRKGNSVFAKELQTLMAETHIVSPEHLAHEPHGVPLKVSQAECLALDLYNESKYWDVSDEQKGQIIQTLIDTQVTPVLKK